MDRDQAGAIIRRVGWLSETPPAFQSKFLSRCDLLHHPKGAAVYHAGDDAGGLFGVVSGSINLYLLSPDGRNELGHVGGPGFWTGDLAALTGRPRRLSIAAASACSLLRLPRSRLFGITEEEPGTWRFVASLIAGNLALALDAIDALKRDDPTQRVAATLLNLAGAATGKTVSINISQSNLASIARMSRNAASISLGNLQDRGLIRCGYGAIDVLDVAAISRLVRSQ